VRSLANLKRSTAPSNGMDAKSSAGVPLSSPAAAQRCAKGAGLDSGAAAAAQSAMPSIALPATASTADLLSTNAAAPAAPQLPSVSNLHQLDGRDPHHRQVVRPLILILLVCTSPGTNRWSHHSAVGSMIFRQTGDGNPLPSNRRS